LYQILSYCNQFKPFENILPIENEVKLRGYKLESFLPGQIIRKIENNEINTLSVSDIADRYCLTRRSLYFRKGINKPEKIKEKKTWGRKSGIFVEKFCFHSEKHLKIPKNKNYSELKKITTKSIKKLMLGNKKDLTDLYGLESKQIDAIKGDTDFLVKLLEVTINTNNLYSYAHEKLKEKTSIDINDIKTNHKIKEPDKRLGIGKLAIPDFIIPKYNIVGDIKSGEKFVEKYQLTCTGYALAFESKHGKGNDINWGIIYFLPTRNLSKYERPLAFAQFFVFKIDDYLRDQFIYLRNRDYLIIADDKLPKFPDDKDKCIGCRYFEDCIKQGLDLNE